MLKTLENTPDRLVITTSVRPFHSSTTIFDKSSGKARFERTVFFWKRKAIEVPLDDIASITIVPQQTTTPQGGQVEGNHPLVQLKSGQRFWLSDAGSQAESIEAVQLMRNFLGASPTEADGAPAADQPIVAPHPSRIYRWATIAVSALAAIAFLIIGAAKITSFFALPECGDEATRKTLSDIFAEKKIKLNGLDDLKTVTSTRSARTCTGRADIPAGLLNLEYRIDWSGWNKRVTIARAEAEAKIEDARLNEVKKAVDDFMDLAKDSHMNGRPPRQSQQNVNDLLDKIWDVSDIEGTRLVVADIGKANEWFAAGDRVGTVYILAGTGVNDMDKLPNEANVQQRTRRNVVDFAPEFARYLDFQMKLVFIMLDAELNRVETSERDALDRNDVKQEIATVRTTVAETLAGALTTLAYDGLTDDWRRARLKLMQDIVPKAAKLLSSEQARGIHDHAIRVTSYIRDKSVQDSVKTVADDIVK